MILRRVRTVGDVDEGSALVSCDSILGATVETAFTSTIVKPRGSGGRIGRLTGSARSSSAALAGLQTFSSI